MNTCTKFFFLLTSCPLLFSLLYAFPVEAAYHFADYSAHPPLHIYASTGSVPKGVTPDEIKKLYNLPETGGSGTIVILGAYNDSVIEKDLTNFDTQFNLPACTKKNKCLTQHLMSGSEANATGGWQVETALDVEWAHAIAPNAQILLVEAATPSGANLLKAIDYAAKQKNVKAISMSWGGTEFPDETTLDTHFKSVSNAVFVASSGDSGTGVSWPAASPKVLAVGGTTVQQDSGSSKEIAWSGSGGGVSAYEKAPAFQTSYGIASTNGMRAIPDVAYDANPASGFPVVHNGTWQTVGGTSAGAPQWAGIIALGTSTTASNLYKDAAMTTTSKYLHDIVSGENGLCGYYCTARKGFDFVTGLGTPQTNKY